MGLFKLLSNLFSTNKIKNLETPPPIPEFIKNQSISEVESSSVIPSRQSKEKEFRITCSEADSDRLHIIWDAMFAYYDVLKCDYMPKMVDLFTIFMKAHKNLLSICEEYSYTKLVKEANKDLPIARLKSIRMYIKEPQSINIQELTYNKFKDYVLNYRSYWESVISGLSRKHAIKNRRIYLQENIDKMMSIVSNYPDLQIILSDYKQFNNEKLSELQN